MAAVVVSHDATREAAISAAAPRAKVTLENTDDRDMVLYYQINYTLTDIPDDAAYFHAQFRREDPVKTKGLYTILDGVEGQGRAGIGTGQIGLMALEPKHRGRRPVEQTRLGVGRGRSFQPQSIRDPERTRNFGDHRWREDVAADAVCG